MNELRPGDTVECIHPDDEIGKTIGDAREFVQLVEKLKKIVRANAMKRRQMKAPITQKYIQQVRTKCETALSVEAPTFSDHFDVAVGVNEDDEKLMFSIEPGPGVTVRIYRDGAVVFDSAADDERMN